MKDKCFSQLPWIRGMDARGVFSPPFHIAPTMSTELWVRGIPYPGLRLTKKARPGTMICYTLRHRKRPLK